MFELVKQRMPLIEPLKSSLKKQREESESILRGDKEEFYPTEVLCFFKKMGEAPSPWTEQLLRNCFFFKRSSFYIHILLLDYKLIVDVFSLSIGQSFTGTIKCTGIQLKNISDVRSSKDVLYQYILIHRQSRITFYTSMGP